MISQRVLIVCAVLAGCLSAALYLYATQRTPIVVAARDVETLRPLGLDDLEVRAMPPDILPDGALTRVDDAVGRVPRSPLVSGQPLVSRALSNDTAAFQTGLTLPAGALAIALPLNATNAVGGSIVPGARVDVLAVPVLGRAPAGRTTELLARAVLVLDVRSESGTPFLTSGVRSVTAGERIGSVVVAIPATDELRFADRIATSMFVLAFSSSR